MSTYCPRTGEHCGRLDCDPPYDCIDAEMVYEEEQEAMSRGLTLETKRKVEVAIALAIVLAFAVSVLVQCS